MTPRILFFAFTRSSLGHITRTVHLGRALRDGGAEVMVACWPEFAHLPEQAGLDHHPVHEIEPAPEWAKPRTPEEFRTFVRTRLASPEYVAACLEDERAAIRAFSPDLVVSDMRNTASVAASLAGLPSVTVHNLQLFVHPLNTILPEVVATLAGLGIDEPHRNRCLGDVLAVPDTAEASPASLIPAEIRRDDRLMPALEHIGPVMGPLPAGGTDRPAWVEAHGLAPDLPILTVTLGGSAMGTRPLRDIAAVLADLPVNAVIITGPSIDPAEIRRDLPPPRGGRSVIGFTDRLPSLLAASDAAVLHGGHSTATEAVATGLPIVVVPLIPEQAEVAASMGGFGYVSALEPAQIRDGLRRRVESALSAPARERARAGAGKWAEAAGGTANFAHLVDRILREGARV